MADQDDSLETLTEGDKQLLVLARKLANDPKTRKGFLKQVKELHPEQPIPELDTEAQVLAAVKPYIEKTEAMEKRMLEDSVKGRINARRAELKEQGFTDDDVKAIEELMVKEQIPNHATAAKYYKHERTAAQPTTSPASMMTTKLPIGKKAINEAGGIKNWARTEAGKAIDDFRSGRVKLH